MKPFTIDVDLDALDRDGIAQAQNITANTAMTLNGALGTTLDYARIIGIYSGADCSGSAFTIVGTNSNGESISETIATGPNNGTVVSTKLYKAIASVTPSATIAQNVEVGNVQTTLSAESKVYPLPWRNGVAATVHVDVSGTINFTVQETFGDVFGTAGVAGLVWNSPTALASKTADTVAQISPHATALKVVVNSYSDTAELQAYVATGSSTRE